MVTNYQRGAFIERKAKQQLEAEGYTVIRSAGSKSAIDILAFNLHEFRLIQLKRTKKLQLSSYKQDINRLKALEYPNQQDIVKLELWVWIDNKGWYNRVV